MKRLHVVGCPRSGTTLLLELLACSFEFDARSEFEHSIFKPFPQGIGKCLSKQPTDILHLRPLLDRDSSLYAIGMLRDPRAVVSSRHEATGGYFSNYRIWKQCELSARTLADHPRYLQIRYEELVQDPDKIQQQILRRFPFLVFRHLFSEFQQHANPQLQSLQALNGLRPVRGDSIDKWKQHLPRVKAQLEMFPGMQQDLERLGFEHNADWQRQLAAVDARQFDCRYSDGEQLLKECEKRLRLWLKLQRYYRRLQVSQAQTTFAP